MVTAPRPTGATDPGGIGRRVRTGRLRQGMSPVSTVAALRGGGMDLPPGRGHALPYHQLRNLSPEERRTLLSTHGVGRVAASASFGPASVVRGAVPGPASPA